MAGWGVLSGLGTGFQNLGQIWGPGLLDEQRRSADEKRRELAEQRAGEAHVRAGQTHEQGLKLGEKSMALTDAQLANAKRTGDQADYTFNRQKTGDELTDLSGEYYDVRDNLPDDAVSRLTKVNPNLVSTGPDGKRRLNLSMVYSPKELQDLEEGSGRLAILKAQLPYADRNAKADLDQKIASIEASRNQTASAAASRRLSEYNLTQAQQEFERGNTPMARALQQPDVKMGLTNALEMIKSYHETLSRGGDVASFVRDAKPMADNAARMWAEATYIEAGRPVPPPGDQEFNEMVKRYSSLFVNPNAFASLEDKLAARTVKPGTPTIASPQWHRQQTGRTAPSSSTQ